MHDPAQWRLDLPYVPPGHASVSHTPDQRWLWRPVPLAQLGWSPAYQERRARDRWPAHRQALWRLAPDLERAHAGGGQAGRLRQDGWQRAAADEPDRPGRRAVRQCVLRRRAEQLW